MEYLSQKVAICSIWTLTVSIKSHCFFISIHMLNNIVCPISLYRFCAETRYLEMDKTSGSYSIFKFRICIIIQLRNWFIT